MTQYQTEAKWPWGFCIGLNKQYCRKDNDTLQYSGFLIMWVQTHQRLPSARRVMLLNSAIRCIVISHYPSIYGCKVMWQRLPSCQELAPSREHFILQRDGSHCEWAEDLSECLLESPWCLLTLQMQLPSLMIKNHPWGGICCKFQQGKLFLNWM